MVYLASPFFNEFEEKVKEDMIERVRKDFPTEKLFNPEDSEVSESYGKGGASASKSSRFGLARAIYFDNVHGIELSNILVFPKWTTDLGTLFEVGYALGLNKTIYRYNYLTQKLEKIPDVKPPFNSEINLNRRIQTVSDAVKFGLLASNKKIAQKLSYKLAKDGLADNLMLAANFLYESDDGKLVKPEDRNWEGIL